MAATTYEAEIASNNPSNIFKAQGGIIYAAPLATVIPTAFTASATADFQALPAAWVKLGLITKGDGIVFSHDLSTDDEESWGYSEPTRTDIVSNKTSAVFTLQETTRQALEMFDYVDLSAVTSDAVTGEYSYSKPLVPQLAYRRLIFLAVDGVGTDRRYRIKVMPRAQVVAIGDEAWQQSAATKFQMTVRATVDPTLGYAVRNVLAGPGQLARKAGAGFL